MGTSYNANECKKYFKDDLCHYKAQRKILKSPRKKEYNIILFQIVLWVLKCLLTYDKLSCVSEGYMELVKISHTNFSPQADLKIR